MFTGIIEAIGTLKQIKKGSQDAVLTVNADTLDLSQTQIGDCIAVNGVCLTVTSLSGNEFQADASHETLTHTGLGLLQPGQPVNLEKALTLSTPLGGHLVSGHVDGVATLKQRQQDGRSVRLHFAVPPALMRYIAAKGSVTLDGTSLTVNEIDAEGFSVNLIPETLNKTTLKHLTPGKGVNLEVDLIARYLERLLLGSPGTESGTATSSGSGLTLEKLARFGYT
jgi:riboflavin synthase